MSDVDPKDDGAPPGLHPSIQALTAFATGAEPLAGRAKVANHLAACTICAAVVAELEEAEGRKLIDGSPSPMAHDALNAALARLQAELDEQDRRKG